MLLVEDLSRTYSACMMFSRAKHWLLLFDTCKAGAQDKMLQYLVSFTNTMTRPCGPIKPTSSFYQVNQRLTSTHMIIMLSKHENSLSILYMQGTRIMNIGQSLMSYKGSFELIGSMRVFYTLQFCKDIVIVRQLHTIVSLREICINCRSQYRIWLFIEVLLVSAVYKNSSSMCPHCTNLGLIRHYRTVITQNYICPCFAWRFTHRTNSPNGLPRFLYTHTCQGTTLLFRHRTGPAASRSAIYCDSTQTYSMEFTTDIVCITQGTKNNLATGLRDPKHLVHRDIAHVDARTPFFETHSVDLGGITNKETTSSIIESMRTMNTVSKDNENMAGTVVESGSGAPDYNLQALSKPVAILLPIWEARSNVHCQIPGLLTKADVDTIVENVLVYRTN